MKVFTIESGKVTKGVRVDSFTLKGAGVTIPAIIVGEEGRGRKLGVLPVQLLSDSYKEWLEKGRTHIFFAEVGTTKAGKPKLLQTEDADTLEKCICVFRTQIGFRGGNSHTGDRDGEEGKDEKDLYYWGSFHPFPGEVLCTLLRLQGRADTVRHLGREGGGGNFLIRQKHLLNDRPAA